MHKYHELKLFHVLSEDKMKVAHAPKVVEGVMLSPSEAAALSPEKKLAHAVDIPRRSILSWPGST